MFGDKTDKEDVMIEKNILSKEKKRSSKGSTLINNTNESFEDKGRKEKYEVEINDEKSVEEEDSENISYDNKIGNDFGYDSIEEDSDNISSDNKIGMILEGLWLYSAP